MKEGPQRGVRPFPVSFTLLGVGDCALPEPIQAAYALLCYLFLLFSSCMLFHKRQRYQKNESNGYAKQLRCVSIFSSSISISNGLPRISTTPGSFSRLRIEG